MEVYIFLHTRLQEVMPCCSERTDAGQDCCLNLAQLTVVILWEFLSQEIHYILVHLRGGSDVQFWSRMFFKEGFFLLLGETMPQVFGQVLSEGFGTCRVPYLGWTAGSKLGMPDSLYELESLSDFLLLERLALQGAGFIFLMRWSSESSSTRVKSIDQEGHVLWAWQSASPLLLGISTCN